MQSRNLGQILPHQRTLSDIHSARAWNNSETPSTAQEFDPTRYHNNDQAVHHESVVEPPETPLSILSPTMGQSASSQREEPIGRDHRRFSQIILERTRPLRQAAATVQHEPVLERSESPQSAQSATMGQSTSSQREEHFERDHRRFSQFILERTRSYRQTVQEGDFRRHTLYNPLGSRPSRGQTHI